MVHCLYCGRPANLLQRWKLRRGGGKFCSSDHLEAYTALQTQALKRLMKRSAGLESDEEAPLGGPPVAVPVSLQNAIPTPTRPVVAAAPAPPAREPRIVGAQIARASVVEKPQADPPRITLPAARPTVTASAEPPVADTIAEKKWAGRAIPLEKIPAKNSTRLRTPSLSPRLISVHPVKPPLAPAPPRLASATEIAPHRAPLEIAGRAAALPLGSLTPEDSMVGAQVNFDASDHASSAPVHRHAAVFQRALSWSAHNRSLHNRSLHHRSMPAGGSIPIDAPHFRDRFVVKPGWPSFEFFDAVSQWTTPRMDTVPQGPELQLAGRHEDREWIHWTKALAPIPISREQIPVAIEVPFEMPPMDVETRVFGLPAARAIELAARFSPGCPARFSAQRAPLNDSGTMPEELSPSGGPALAQLSTRLPSFFARALQLPYGLPEPHSAIPLRSGPARRKQASGEFAFLPKMSLPIGPGTLAPAFELPLEPLPAFSIVSLLGDPLAPPAAECLSHRSFALLPLNRGTADQIPESGRQLPALRSITIDCAQASSEPMFAFQLLPLTRFTAHAKLSRGKTGRQAAAVTTSSRNGVAPW